MNAAIGAGSKSKAWSNWCCMYKQEGGSACKVASSLDLLGNKKWNAYIMKRNVAHRGDSTADDVDNY